MYLFAICLSSSVKYVVESFVHFCIELFVFKLLNCKSSLHILDISPLWYSRRLAFSFIFFLNGIFRRTGSFFLVKLKLSMFFFTVHASCVLSKKLFSTSASSGSFVVLHFAVSIIIDVQLIFECNVRYEFIFIFFHMDVQFFQSFSDWKILASVEETLLSPLNYLATFVTS